MAYNKKNWQDNVSDITAAELNRMEQGIYDNSLVIDVIKDKLNPTDTETYKTAELTEGQITDVIGVSDIVIKGQTSQDGEPTPSSPVDVNAVSGSNVIKTSNKNILDLSNYKTTTQNGITLTPVFQGNRLLYIQSSGTYSTTSYFLLTNDLKLKPNTTYSLKGAYSASARLRLREYDSNFTQLSEYFDTGSGITFTTKANVYVVNIQIVFYAQNNAKFYPMLEQGSTATTYEPHQDKELPLDLPVENLFDKDNEAYTKGYIYNTSSTSLIDSNYNRTLYISCKPNTTYAIQKMVAKDMNKFLIASSVDVPATGVNIYNVVDGGMNNTRAIYTTSNNAKYLLITYIQTNATSTTLEEMLNSIQIEEGSEVNAYTPYGTDPIELCKIGTYQDYFYKSGSKWYLHKEIGKKILDGSENWQLANSGTSNYYYYYNLGHTTIQSSSIASTHYPYAFISNSNTEQGILVLADGNIRIRYGTENTVANFKTWLATNNVSVYYPLATATNTEITDTTLISQLEAIYNAPLYEQTNITQTNNDLPMVLDITACKDNINGIKAFIRK